jgi:hypothetical protein
LSSATSESYDNTIVEFPITEEIKELEIFSVYTGFRNNTIECVLLIEYSGLGSDPLQCSGDNIFEIKITPLGEANGYLQSERHEYQIFGSDPVKIINNDVYILMVKRSGDNQR